MTDLSSQYLLGLKALKKKGIDYSIKQLHLGVEHFERIKMGDYSDVKEVFIGLPFGMDDDFRNNDYKDSSDDSYDDDDDNVVDNSFDGCHDQ